MLQLHIFQQHGDGVRGVELFLQVGAHFEADEGVAMGYDEAVDADVAGFESGFEAFFGGVLSDELEFFFELLL